MSSASDPKVIIYTGVRVAPITVVGEKFFFGTFPSQKPDLIAVLGLSKPRLEGAP